MVIFQCRANTLDDAPGPASIAALRDAIRSGREPPPARLVARLKSYRWLVVRAATLTRA
jgi:hypothetical protein